jgi:hypothetical protein
MDLLGWEISVIDLHLTHIHREGGRYVSICRERRIEILLYCQANKQNYDDGNGVMFSHDDLRPL